MVSKQLSVFDNHWLSLAASQADNDSWVKQVVKDIKGSGGIYLCILRIWFQRFPLKSNKDKGHLKEGLESFNTKDHLGAVNELSWWELMTSFGWSAQPLPAFTTSRPDFHILTPTDFFCEVTTLNVSEKDRMLLDSGKGVRLNHGPTIGRILRKITNSKKEQIEYGASKKKSSILVLFDYTTWSGFGARLYRELVHYLLGENFGFLSLPSELSAMIYTERKVIDGHIVISKERSAVYHNPQAVYPIPETIFQMMRQFFLRLDEVEPSEFITTKDHWFLL